MRLVLLASLAFSLAAPLAAQHDHGAAPTGQAEVYVVEGLRVDPADPPPGSGVGRAGATLPGGGYLHVVYGKPYVRGRQIFGGLVAWDAIWATGAHRSTELVVTVPVTVGGMPLAPGVYRLLTTPSRDHWTLHLNTALGGHLADDYNPALDVLRVEGIPETLDAAQQGLLIEFVPAGPGVDLRIAWDRTAVRFPIRPR